MASVDNRIVNMTFNNAEFESRVASTVKSLQSLDKTIAEVGGKSGLDKLNTEANKFNLDGMSSAIEGVSAKFIALSTIGITALVNLTNKAIDAGIQIAKSLAIEPITSGFAEYELKLGSIQTIMAGSGADLETVNRKLAELNEYSDKTIYSFADMTTNIGKFTNAGVDLDTSVASIQGIANVAAVSGANAEEASRAMYNFAQALSKGYVQLVDWKSIELANMGTVEFKTQLLDAAVATGTLTKKGEEYVTKKGTLVSATKNFNDSLQDQWLTTDALNKTLGDYADQTTEIGKKAFASAQDIKTFTQLMDTTKESVGSGWAQTFEILFGGFDDAKHLWGALGGAIGDFVNKSSEKRNKFLGDWRNLGGQMEVAAGLYLAFQNLKDLLKPIVEAFREVFPPMTAQRAYELSKAFREFMEAVKPSEATVENIGRIFKGLFNVLDVGWEILKAGVGAIKDFVGSFAGIGSGGILEFLAGIGDVLASLDADKIVGGLEAAFSKIGEIFRNPLPYIQEFISFLKTALSDLGDMFRNPLPAIEDFVGTIGEFFSGLSVSIPDFSGPLSGAVEKIKEVFGSLGNVLSGISLPDVSFDGIFNAIGNVFSQIVEKITGFFSSGGEMASSVQDAAGGIDWETVMAAVGIGMVGGLLATVNRLISKGINIDFTGGVLSSISETFGQLTGVLKTMQNDIKSNILIKIAAAIGILALAMIALSFIDAGDLAKSLTAIAIGFGQLAAAMAILNKIDFSTSDALKFSLMALSFTLLSGSLILLAAAMKIFASMSWEELAKGGVVFTGVVIAIVAMSHLLENEASGMIKASVAMLLMAFSMGAMAKSISKFGEMDTAVLVQGFIGLAAAMALLVTTMNLLPSDMEKKTAGLVGFSVALSLMVFAIKQLGQMDLADLVQGGVAFALMLGGLVIALNKMPANMAAKATQLLGLAGAMLIMSFALKSFASLGWGEMVQGLTAMAGALLILVIAMQAASGGIAGAAAMIIMSAAMLVLAAAIRAFAAISLGDFAKGMILMAAGIAVLAAVAFVLQPALPALLLLGVALAAIGLAVAALGFGLAQVATGLAIMAKIGPEGADGIVAVMKALGQGIPAIFAGIAQGIGEFVEVLTGFIPIFIKFGVDLLTALLEGFIQIMPLVFETVTVFLTGLVGVITEMVPQFVLMGVNILIALLEGIAEALPQLVAAVAGIITGFLDALAEAVPGVISSVTNLFVTIWLGVAEALGQLVPTLLFGTGIALLQGFFDGMTSMAGKLWDLLKEMFNKVIETVKSIFGINSPSTVFLDIGVDLITGFLNGIVEAAVAVWNWFSALASTVLGWIGSLTSTLVGKGWDIIQSFITGYLSIIGTVTSFFTGLAGDILGWIGNLAFTLWSKATELIGGFVEGITNAMVTVISWWKNLGSSILGWLGDMGKVLWNAGMAVIQGFWDGMKEVWNKVTGWLDSLAGIIPDWKGPPEKDKVILIENGMLIMGGLLTGMQKGWKENQQWLSSLNPADEMDMSGLTKAMEAASSFIEGNIDTEIVITPVLDLTKLKLGTAAMKTMLGDNSYAQAGLIASSQQVTDEAAVTPGVTEIKFEQTINAPTQLSTAEIYRQTRNQITLAKEELSIP